MNNCNFINCPICSDAKRYDTIDEYKDAEFNGDYKAVAEFWEFNPAMFSQLRRKKTYRFEVSESGKHSRINEKRETRERVQ
jgi:hypothetical protein